MQNSIKNLSAAQESYLIDTYRYLHAHPELSFQELETSLFIQSELKKMDIPFRTGIGGYGILATIEGRNPAHKTIALRADMDALPICEAESNKHRSVNEKIMHACGHDAHTTCLLGAARILQKLKTEFVGTVLLVFQPGEEKSPGGASLMLSDGVFRDCEPDLILAQHVSVDHPTGTLAFLPGKIMASADEIHVRVKGQGGHGALPHLFNDTVLAAAQTLVSLQQLRSRLCPPLVPMVLTFGKFVALGAQNIIPHEVHLSGTFRTVDEGWRAQAKEHIVRIVNETCAAHGCTADIDIPSGYPCLVNDETITRKAREYAIEWVGEEQVKDLELRLTSEDFAFFSQQYPSCFYRFGVRGESNIDVGGLHTANFSIDEAALQTGAGGMAWLAWRFLND